MFMADAFWVGVMVHSMSRERKMNRMDDLISKLSEIRSEYNCFDEDEEPYYRALSKAIRILSRHTDDDTISRKAAIDEIDEWIKAFRENGHKESAADACLIQDGIIQLPSAQPERPSEIQDILDYLDTTLHPLISPEYWNVYSELHDMISTLPSAERREVQSSGCEYWDSESNFCSLHRPSAERHGRWIIEDKYTDYRTERCSACGFAANRAYIQDIWHYCPNCGAKMDSNATQHTECVGNALDALGEVKRNEN